MIAARLATDSSSGVMIGMLFADLGPGVAITGALNPIAFAEQEGWRIVWFVIRLVRPHRWKAVFARFTVGFGLALTIGSATTGTLSDSYGLITGVAISAALLAVAALHPIRGFSGASTPGLSRGDDIPRCVFLGPCQCRQLILKRTETTEQLFAQADGRLSSADHTRRPQDSTVELGCVHAVSIGI